jgi:hypothetical protein
VAIVAGLGRAYSYGVVLGFAPPFAAAGSAPRSSIRKEPAALPSILAVAT